MTLSDRITAVLARVTPSDARELQAVAMMVRRMEMAMDEITADAMATADAARQPGVIPIAGYLARSAMARAVQPVDLRKLLDEALT